MITSPRYAEALGWAEQLHRHQSRHGKAVPFLSHVISVSALVWEDGGNEDQAIAGLLHDSIEDAGQTRASIRERFGGAVADIVRDCTDPGKVLVVMGCWTPGSFVNSASSAHCSSSQKPPCS